MAEKSTKTVYGKREKKSKKGIVLIISAILVLAAVTTIMVIFFVQGGAKTSISLNTDTQLAEMSGEQFFIDVKVDGFPQEGHYPAASFSLNFDKTKLQFEGISVGNMTVSDELNSQESLEIPTWQCNTQLSNENGNINAMYIDMTAQDRSYRAQNFQEDTQDILVRLEFTLLNSASSGDDIKLEFVDAVLASVDENGAESGLSMVDGTLLAQSLSLRVG